METYRLADDAPETDPRVFREVWPGLELFAERLVRILGQTPATTPVLLSGDWGAGKTTVLEALKQRLGKMDEKGEPRRTVILFEAWRYDGKSSLLPALIRQVWDMAPLEWRNRHPDMLEKLYSSAVTVGMKAAPEVAKWMAVPVLPALLTGLQAPKAPEVPARWEPPEDPVQQLWTRFDAMVSEAWAGKPAPLVLVDDLDRCDPAGMVAVLEHIRMLVSAPKNLHCRFLVAIDRSIVVQAVGRKFDGISGYDGNRYLEKVFPLSFNLPAPTPQEVARLIEHVWGKRSTPADKDHRDALTQALRDPFFANPRLIKRVVNKYGLVQSLEEPETDSERPVALRNRYIARWLAATERWPRLRPLLVRQSDDYWEHLQKQLANGSHSDPDAESLLKEQGARAWLQRELLKDNPRANLLHYRDAEARLQRLGL